MEPLLTHGAALSLYVLQVQTIEASEAGRLLSGKPAVATPAAAVPAQPQQPHVQLQLVVDEAQQSVAVSFVVIQPAAAPANSKPAAAAPPRGPSTSSISRLPGRRLGFGAGLGAKPAGDSSISALLGGAWAAGGAGGGDGVDSGDERAVKKARKGPAKRVSWRNERELVAVRWFIKDDPPVQVSC